MSSVKRFLFSHYGWLAAIAAVTAFVLYANGIMPREVLYVTVGGIVSFAYFVQKQKLDETKLFQELFDKFNKRYNDFNDKLLRVRFADPSASLTSEETELLIDYFNLCAEEYLYFKLGYIFSEVWQSWYNGMQQYYKNPRIRPLWDSESGTNSYYGFHPDRTVRDVTCSWCGRA